LKENIPGNHCSVKTFRRAFRQVTKTKGISFSRKKANFATCEICLNASDLVCNTKDAELIKVIENYKFKHISTQQQQRDSMDETMDECKKWNPSMKTAEKAFILIDAITKYRGETPAIRSENNVKRKSKSDENKPCFGDRMFGALVVCGPIRAYIMFHCDDFVTGGANCVIEILRLTILKLAEMLAERGIKLPKHLALQFDNCGENKNQHMFSYLSLLNEISAFETIKVSFLIVGHTHCLIDQWFSVVTKIINKQAFIGTPLAMEELLYTTNSASKFENPAKQQHVHAVYDVKSALDPYINKNIIFYQVISIVLFNP
jgi:hypothetical protein